ncbi:hypothetical protein OEZ86_008329 [Tetradesmus obliquus]|nr:hypothetical protein OEZ86_008329 [Tetradesmus obliquus]
MAQLPRSAEGWYEYGHTVQLSAAALAECRLWVACIQKWNGFLVAPVHVSRVVYTDGCGSGFGGLVHRVMGRKVEPALQSIAGTWEAEMSVDSVMTELYVGAGVIINSGADMLSRDRDASDCQLVPAMFEFLWGRFGPFVMDMFASGASAQAVPGTQQLLPYWSLWADGVAAGVDALTADWKAVAARGVLYAFPPVPLVGEVIRLVIAANVRAVVVLPKWQSHWWWPWVLQYAREAPISLSEMRPEGVLQACREDGPTHPFGPNWQNPQSVEWLAVLF